MNNSIDEKIERALDMFDGSFIHRNEELILHKKWNVYFRIEGLESANHFDYKMLSYLSFYMASHHYKKTSVQCIWAWNKLNRWFRKDFTYEDLQTIYSRIGVGANSELGISFIESGLDMSVLEQK